MLGGSFDPPHLGHEHIAVEAAEQLNLQRLYLVPAHRSPFKSGHGARGFRRMEMLERSASAIKRRVPELQIKILDVELKRGGSSYSYQTLEYISRELSGENHDYTNSELYLIIGEDNLKTFTLWKQWKNILELARLAVLPRETGRGRISLPEDLEHVKERIRIVNAPVFPAASSSIREMIARGDNTDTVLNKEVYEYIRDNSLYSI
ncbi:Nicotinate-nucleotide adenylyltransferase [Salinispira pacifica]|uniref:Probable nicotinate-nucleotide adenylyltransferase n=1 Tax=Salinispira pacifica TaxID=1307761 RepID=V5WGC3_9SPIO|nr:Nicotinate-nucleotide adenylyltransferase [Salinispira pacifica]